MRLDLYLKTSRLVKRRTVAQSLCENGQVLVNGHPARAAKEIRLNDIITLTFSTRRLEIEVTGIPEKPAAGRSNESYRLISEQRIREQDDLLT